jgi:hypothetical protein
MAGKAKKPGRAHKQQKIKIKGLPKGKKKYG